METGHGNEIATTFDLFIRKERMTVVQGDGRANTILLARNRRMYEVTPRYLAHLTRSIGARTNIEEKDILDLPVVDMEWALVENYRAHYGDMLEFEEMHCPSKECRRTADHSLDLGKLEVIQLPVELRDSEDPTIAETLPKSGFTATVGMLNGHRERLLLSQQASGKIDPNQADFQALRELNGSRDFFYEDVVALPLLDHKVIRKMRRRLICGYNTIADFECPYCGHTWSLNFLTQRDFLLPAG